MSHDYYKEIWLVARDDLEKLLELDRSNQQVRSTSEKQDGLDVLLPTYLRYRNLVKRLIVCHDQIVQTQKRDLIKRVLDCAVGRMLEYKRAIVGLEYTDYLWPDNFMNQLKYTPDDVEINVSAMGKDLVDQRKKLFKKLIEDAQKSADVAEEEEASIEEKESVAESEESASRLRRRKVKESREESQTPSFFQETPEEIAAGEARAAAEETMQNAILLIQSHERARQDRCVGLNVQRVYIYNQKLEAGEIVPKKIHRRVYEKSARIIQRTWRRYVIKKALRKRVSRIEELLGMTQPYWQSDQLFVRDREHFEQKLELMPKFADRITETTNNERARLLKIRGPGLIEDITDEIRESFLIWYNEVGHFGVYPAAQLGGSVLIATGQSLTPQEFLAQRAAKNKKDKGAAKPDATKKKTGANKKDKTWIASTEAFSLLDDSNKDFVQNWSFREYTDNPQEKIYMDLIRNKLCYELQLEMRKVVDELMRLELQRLNRALKKDCARDNREIDIPKDKSKKKKKRKNRKKKNPLGDIATEDLFKELAQANIIKYYPITSLKDWIGDLSYQNYEAIRESLPHKYRMGEIKQVVMENCILPLSSKEVHRIAPLIRSVCICGLPRHGKSFLANAICSEVGALLFDMTPTVLVDKYVGRKNERRLINIISKVAREYAPSVIFIDNGEKPWAKKVLPEERQYKPKRFGKYYPKLIKGIKRGDQILFLTTSSEPYKARGPFIRIHDKFIMIPLTDYNTLYMFYKDLLMKYHGVHRNIDVSCLAKISEGIPLLFIKNAVENVLNLRRRITLKFNPLNPKEIMEELLKYEAPQKKVLTQLTNFENRTPLGRKRRQLLALEKVRREREAKIKKAR